MILRLVVVSPEVSREYFFDSTSSVASDWSVLLQKFKRFKRT